MSHLLGHLIMHLFILSQAHVISILLLNPVLHSLWL